jgi:LCP family protein required for cell wall assembly
MKTFIKVFIVSFLCFFIAIFLGIVTSLKANNMDISGNIGIGYAEKEQLSKVLLTKLETQPKEEKSYSSFQEALKHSPRVNVLVLGMEDVRTDTILLASFHRDAKKIDIISIPRDTYIHRKGYNGGDQRKINSVYYSHGVKGVMQTVSYILEDIPIHHYAMIDYDGVISIVDLVGGVEVDVPFHMKYDDPTAKPPLNIDIKKGRQTLDGKRALDFIRWRKNNNNDGYVDGDIGRIKAQQQLLQSLSSKISDNLLSVITKGYNYVETDMGLFDIISYGRNAIGMDKSNIKFHLLPGESDLRPINRRVYSYYVYNQKEIKSLLEEIYNVRSQ